MQLTDILVPARVHKTTAGSKKEALEEISRLVSQDSTELAAKEVFNNLCARERLGSTAVGRGVAIPHSRLAGLEQPLGVFLTLKQGVEFEAADDTKVDLLFALLVPEEATEQHLGLLAQVAKLLSQRENCEQLRQAEDDQSLYSQLVALNES